MTFFLMHRDLKLTSAFLSSEASKLALASPVITGPVTQFSCLNPFPRQGLGLLEKTVNIKKGNRVTTVAKGSKRDNSYTDNSKVVSITYEEIGLFPRSFSRVLDRFLKQLFSDVDNLVIGEYRFYRYLFLTTIKTILILFLVPFIVNFVSKNFIVKPLAEYFWNSGHPEIFLNSYEQKRAFAELERFEEKIYFEALVSYNNYNNVSTSNLGSQGHSRVLDAGSAPLSATYMGALDPRLVADTNDPLLQRSSSNPFGVKALASGVLSNSEGLPGSQAVSKDIEKTGSYYQIPYSERSDELKGSAISNNSFEVRSQQIVSPENLGSKGQLLLAVNNPLGLLTGPGTNSLPNNSLGVISNSQQAEDFFTGYNQSKNVFKIYGEKAVELATNYNNRSIEAITNFFADLLSLGALLYLLVTLEIQIQITKSFLAEVFFGLDDSKKSLLILLVTDLLVGYHSSNLWELFFGMIFNHYGIPESQTGIFLLVATLPVLLDVLFKYLIFRHLNRSSPATVATYQAMIE